MLREFFLIGDSRVFAWFGLVVFLGHQGFKAYLAAAINDWYGNFYDILQTHVEEASGDVEFGGLFSGDAASGEAAVDAKWSTDASFSEARAKVRDELVNFVWLVAPAVFVHPLAGLIRNWWVFRWRRTLMRSYLMRWNTQVPAIEGASQRVHEDTQRFAAGIHSCVSKVINSLLTLIVFCPILFGIDVGMMFIAIAAALGGLGVSVLLGWPLVDLEVGNQRVEAQLRRRLVLLEATPLEVHKTGTPYSAFTQIFHHLTLNYRSLYLAFAALNTWLSAFDQSAIILPYLIAAPRLFAADPASRFSLGQLMKITNAFGKVFDAMNIVSDNWLEINEWRSVLRRLSEFERDVTAHITPSARLMPSEMELSDATDATEAAQSVPDDDL
tara:strand:- start:3761 stop:4912 length:1152 start_codon:yes stop_codon:yes gene_type:complete